MDRRKFLTLSAFSLPAASFAQEEAPRAAVDPNDPENWRSAVHEVMEFTAKSLDGSLSLAVKLIKPEEGEVTQVDKDNGEFSHYVYKGQKLDEGYWQGRTVLEQFEFRWGGEKIAIPERFWKHLPGFDIRVSELKREDVKEDLAPELEEFHGQLRQPRVILSADGGTALVEWTRGEECDGRSTIRWIISRSGTVMRHRHTPPHEC